RHPGGNAGEHRAVGGHAAHRHVVGARATAHRHRLGAARGAADGDAGTGEAAYRPAEDGGEVDRRAVGRIDLARGLVDRYRGRRGVVEHRDGDRGGGGAVAGGIARDGGQRVRAVARGGGVPGDRIRCRGVFHAEVGAIEQELHADDSDVVGGVGRHAGGAADGGPRDRRGDADRRRRGVVEHRDGDRGGGGAVAGGIARDGSQRVRAV